MAIQIQLRRDTAANWTAANPTLAQGELGLETDTAKIKFGDGATAWNALAYFGGAHTHLLAAGATDVTATAAEVNLTDGSVAGTIVNSKAVIYGAAGEVNATTLKIAGSSITSTAAELNILDGVTSTATELNKLDGYTGSAADLNGAVSHAADNTQAHSDYLLNSGTDEAVGPLTTTADNSSADTMYIPNVLYNTDDTPPAANTTPVGTIYIKYTA